MPSGKFCTFIKKLWIKLLSWIDLDSKLIPFIIGVALGCLVVIIVLEYLNIMRLVEYFPNWLIAITGCLGLLTWKKKLSYERHMGIVDDFHDTVHNFIIKIGSSIQILQFIKIEIQSYEETFKIDQLRQKNFTCGLEEFIETSGERYGIQLKNILDELPIQHIYTLHTKIYALNMKDKNLALNCYRQLEWFYDTIQKTAAKLGMKSMYWKNPEVVKAMNQLNELDVTQFKKSLDEAKRLMLEFAKNNYK